MVIIRLVHRIIITIIRTITITIISSIHRWYSPPIHRCRFLCHHRNNSIHRRPRQPAAVRLAVLDDPLTGAAVPETVPPVTNPLQ